MNRLQIKLNLKNILKLLLQYAVSESSTVIDCEFLSVYNDFYSAQQLKL